MLLIFLFKKNAWVASLDDKKGITINNAFQKILDQSNRNPNKIWVDEDSEFWNSTMKSWLQDDDIEVHSTHNEGKSVVAERFIRNVENKIYKYMTSILKNEYINRLDDIVNEYSNTYYTTIKMKPINVKSRI